MPVMSLPNWIKALFKPNRRRFDRYAVQFGIRLAVGEQRFDCHMRDVSPSGALLVGAPNLPIGTMVTVEVLQIALTTDARVVRRTDLGLGIEFSKEGVGAIVAGWAMGQSPISE